MSEQYSEQRLVRGFPAISVTYWGRRTDDRTGIRLGIRYCGTADDLIASGVATAEMLVFGRQGRGRKDPDGDSFNIDRYYRCAGGKPTACFRLIFWKREEFLQHLPAAIEALAANEKEQDARSEARSQVAKPASKRPALRLVVDNTRRATP